MGLMNICPHCGNDWCGGECVKKDNWPFPDDVQKVIDDANQRTDQMLADACTAIAAGTLRDYLFKLWAKARKEGFELGVARRKETGQ